MGFLPWEIRVAFPGESQLRQSRATHPTVHAGCFWCFHNPSTSDVDYRIFNVLIWSLCMHTHTAAGFVVWSEGLLLGVESAQPLILMKLALNLTRDGHPSVWWSRSIVLNRCFQERTLSLSAIWPPTPFCVCIVFSFVYYFFSFFIYHWRQKRNKQTELQIRRVSAPTISWLEIRREIGFGL